MAQNDVLLIRIILALSGCLLLVVISLLIKDCASSGTARQFEGTVSVSKKAESAVQRASDPLSIDIRNRLTELEGKSKASAVWEPPK